MQTTQADRDRDAPVKFHMGGLYVQLSRWDPHSFRYVWDMVHDPVDGYVPFPQTEEEYAEYVPRDMTQEAD